MKLVKVQVQVDAFENPQMCYYDSFTRNVNSTNTFFPFTSGKRSRDSEPESESVSCYSFLIYNFLHAAAYISVDIEEIKSSSS